MIKAILSVVAGVVVLMAGIRYIERNSIYFPMREITSDPSVVGLGHEEVYFNTADNRRLHGWFIPREGARFTIVFLHGNAGNISHRLEKIAMFHDLGLNTFIFDYRGYGKSAGSPSEQGLYEDAYAAHRYLAEERNISPADMVLYGESIGGAVAMDLAAKKRVGAVITENTFTSIRDMAAIAYPFIPHFIFSSRFDALSKIRDVAPPKLIIHSVDDEIVPFSLGEKLFAAAKQPKTFLRVRGGHNTAFLESGKEFREGIRSFLEGSERP